MTKKIGIKKLFKKGKLKLFRDKWKVNYVLKMFAPGPTSALYVHACVHSFICYQLRLFTLACLYRSAVAALGFCIWGANRAGNFICGANGGLSAEGAKLRLPKAKSPSRLGGLGSVVSSSDAILNISSQNGVHFGILLISHF